MLGSNSRELRMALNSRSSCLYPASARIPRTRNHSGFYWNFGFFKKYRFFFYLVPGVGIRGCFPSADNDLPRALAETWSCQLLTISAVL